MCEDSDRDEDLIVCEDSETEAGQKHCNSGSVADSTRGFVAEANAEWAIPTSGWKSQSKRSLITQEGI